MNLPFLSEILKILQQRKFSVTLPDIKCLHISICNSNDNRVTIYGHTDKIRFNAYNPHLSASYSQATGSRDSGNLQ